MHSILSPNVCKFVDAIRAGKKACVLMGMSERPKPANLTRNAARLNNYFSFEIKSAIAASSGLFEAASGASVSCDAAIHLESEDKRKWPERAPNGVIDP